MLNAALAASLSHPRNRIPPFHYCHICYQTNELIEPSSRVSELSVIDDVGSDELKVEIQAAFDGLSDMQSNKFKGLDGIAVEMHVEVFA